MNLGDILWNLNWFKYKERLLETNKDLKCNTWQLSITNLSWKYKNTHLTLLGKRVLLSLSKLIFSYYLHHIFVKKVHKSKSQLTILFKHMTVKFSGTIYHTDHNVYCLVNGKSNPIPCQWI